MMTNTDPNLLLTDESHSTINIVEGIPIISTDRTRQPLLAPPSIVDLDGTDTNINFNLSSSPTSILSNLIPEQHEYSPVQPYWFYTKKNQDRFTWIPFSLIDAKRLDEAHAQNQRSIATDGNRFDVDLFERTRSPIYWNTAPNEVRRSRWFFLTEHDSRFTPFDETMDQLLEQLYEETCRQHSWHSKHQINNGTETLIFHNPVLMTLIPTDSEISQWAKFSYESRTLKRGLPEMFFDEINEGEKDPVQHVCFVVHGIGEACDTKFRPLVDCVEDFRDTSLMILNSHFKVHLERNEIQRVEFLPVYWHGDLHLESTGVDNYLLPLTLPSVSKLRTFINTTLSDILFYTSPVYCQKIIARCINEMNRLYDVFLQRNPSFNGQVSVIGHSLGSVILYDILVNQTPANEEQAHSNEEENRSAKENVCVSGTGQVSIQYSKLKFPVAYFFALGSPIAMFLTVRGVTSLEPDYVLPTCKGLLNIFHPYDPVAYRLEPLIDPKWTVSPVLVPHHKGRKRIHLELIDGLSKATDLKQKMVDVVKNTMTSISDFVSSYRSPAIPTPTPTPSSAMETNEITIAELEREHKNDDEDTHIDEWDNQTIGKLNQGRRIDYVLQHRPIEAINDYLFAFASHVSYWDSEDTMLLIMKEILKLDGFEPESQFETIEQMIKSNVLNYFVSNQNLKLNELQPYISIVEQNFRTLPSSPPTGMNLTAS